MNGGIENTIVRQMFEISDLKKVLAATTAENAKLMRQQTDLLSILSELYDALEDNFDVDDDDYGSVRPNRWMQLGTSLAYDVLRATGTDITEG